MGAISYVEYARRLLPDPDESDDEINHLTAAMIPVVYWLVFFSIVVHGLSVPVLNGIYQWLRVATVKDHPVEVLLLSENEPVPNNSLVDHQRHSVMVNNRFSCISSQSHPDPMHEEPDTIRLRSSQNYAVSLERASTKESSHRVEQIREIV